MCLSGPGDIEYLISYIISFIFFIFFYQFYFNNVVFNCKYFYMYLMYFEVMRCENVTIRLNVIENKN